MLTRQQHALLSYLERTMRETGVCPSYVEIAAALGIRSKSGVNRLVVALVERGFVRSTPKRRRSLEVIRMPGEVRVLTPSEVAWCHAHAGEVRAMMTGMAPC